MKKHHYVRTYLIAGLLVWLPIWATIVVIRFVVQLLDGTLSLLPKAYQPAELFGYDIPGLGVLLSLLVVFITGVIATNYLGKYIVHMGEAMVARIPLVRTIYNAVKQVLETIFSSNSQAFRKVLLIEYPRKGLWSIAFQTGQTDELFNDKTGEEMITVFIPTTPNPTSGYLLLIPDKEAIELDLTIDAALKMIISLGVVQPKSFQSIVNAQPFSQ